MAYAASLLQIMGLQPGQQIDHLVLVEPGPWAAVWQVMSQGGALDIVAAMEPWCVPDAEVQRATFGRLRDQVLADELVADPVAEAAAFLWCMSRSINCAPDLHAWMFPFFREEHGGGYRYKADKPVPGVLALAGLRWPRTTVHRCSAVDVEPIPGAIVYMDPPYKGQTGYLANFPPADVRSVAEAWHAAGASVCVSEDRRVVPRWPVATVKRNKAHHWAGKRAEYVTLSPR